MRRQTSISFVVAAAVSLLSVPALAQVDTTAAAEPDTSINWAARHIGLYPKKEESKLRKFTINGFYRFFGTHRILSPNYQVDAGGDATATMARRELFVADDSQLPNLLLEIAGRPTDKSSFGFDLFMFQFLRGDIGQAYTGQVAESDRPDIFNPIGTTRLGPNLGLNLGMTLRGGYQTDIGSFDIAIGGTQWVSMSDLTLAAFQGYNRYSLFERAPWDPIGKSVTDRYSQYYDVGAINQDLRWGEQAFQGVNFYASQLPADLSMRVLYGKTQLNGGFLTIPNTSFGGQLRKPLNNGQFVGFNTFNSQTYTDSLNLESIGFNIHTVDYSFKWNQIQFTGEVGMGRYFSPAHDLDWGEAIQLKFRSEESLTKLPIELVLFRIDENVINNTSVFWNTSIVEVNAAQLTAATGGVADVLRPFASSMVGVGQMTNNRQGLTVNTEFELGDLVVGIGSSAQGELNALSNVITYGPVVNALTRSRMWRWEFVNQVGPYDRYSKIYRGTYDQVFLTDDSLGVAVNKKYFNSLELQGKYNTKVLKRNLWLFYLGRYNSAQQNWSPITVTSEEAYVRHYASELEVYYQFHNRAVLTGYAGYERILGNYNTEVDDFTRRPRNMTGRGIGFGIDYTLARNTALYIRHRFFDFEDASFANDAFNGHETLVELKMIF